MSVTRSLLSWSSCCFLAICVACAGCGDDDSESGDGGGDGGTGTGSNSDGSSGGSSSSGSTATGGSGTSASSTDEPSTADTSGDTATATGSPTGTTTDASTGTTTAGLITECTPDGNECEGDDECHTSICEVEEKGFCWPPDDELCGGFGGFPCPDDLLCVEDRCIEDAGGFCLTPEQVEELCRLQPTRWGACE